MKGFCNRLASRSRPADENFHMAGIMPHSVFKAGGDCGNDCSEDRMEGSMPSKVGLSCRRDSSAAGEESCGKELRDGSLGMATTPFKANQR